MRMNFLYYDCPRFTIFNEMSNAFTYVPKLMIGLYMVTLLGMKLTSTGLSGWWKRVWCGSRGSSSVGGRHVEPGKAIIGTSRHELLFLLQSFIICGVLFVENMCFSILPSLHVTGHWRFVINFFTDCLVVTFNTIHAIVIFTFNARVRSELWKVLGLRSRQLEGASMAPAPMTMVARSTRVCTRSMPTLDTHRANRLQSAIDR